MVLLNGEGGWRQLAMFFTSSVQMRGPFMWMGSLLPKTIIWRFGLRSWILISLLKKLRIPLDAVGLVGEQFYFGKMKIRSVKYYIYTKKFVFYYLVLAFSFLSLFSFSLQKDILYSLLFKITLLPPSTLKNVLSYHFHPFHLLIFIFINSRLVFFIVTTPQL